MITRLLDSPQYIILDGTLRKPDSIPTPQQRAVFLYYEARNSYEADDIYSQEWTERCLSFFETKAQEDRIPIRLTTWEMIEKLEFGEFFLSHPIPAFSLWNLIETVYELDSSVCGASEAVKKCHDQPPFQRMNKSNMKKIRNQYTTYLDRMSKQIESGHLQGESLIHRLYSILSAVEALEKSFVALKENFSVNLQGKMYANEMVERAREVVEQRCHLIADLLNPRAENEDEDEEAEPDISRNCQWELH